MKKNYITNRWCKDTTNSGNYQDIENGRADNGADPNIAMGDESSYKVDEEFRCRSGGCQESGPRHIVRHAQGCDDAIVTIPTNPFKKNKYK